jgi:hypothetical protein
LPPLAATFRPFSADSPSIPVARAPNALHI